MLPQFIFAIQPDGNTMDFTNCTALIRSHICRTATELLPLQKCLERISGTDLFAQIPQPEFNQSLRDGFVVSDRDGKYTITTLIQAGDTRDATVGSGQAAQIMTGGLIPKGGNQVIPQECCRVVNNQLFISKEVLNQPQTHIEPQGARIGQGELVFPAGSRLSPHHIGLLAAVGCTDVVVYKQPKVGFFSTGTELVDSPAQQQIGLKISSNRFLLAALLRQAGCVPIDLGTLPDTPALLQKRFEKTEGIDLDMLISTGGMGPGKFDLIEQAFTDGGGKVLYNRLAMSPGKNSLFGILKNIPFFGLPGPPSAVRALFNALVGPALYRMQGDHRTLPLTIEAQLTHPLSVKQSGIMQLRSASLWFAEGISFAQATQSLDGSNAYLIIPEEKKSYAAGEKIMVQVLGPSIKIQ